MGWGGVGMGVRGVGWGGCGCVGGERVGGGGVCVCVRRC